MRVLVRSQGHFLVDVGNVVDGNTNTVYQSATEGWDNWLMIDLQETLNVQNVRIYNNPSIHWHLNAIEIRIGNSLTFSDNKFIDNPSCGIFAGFQYWNDHACVKSGRYVSIRNGARDWYGHLSLAEVEVYGTKPFSGDEYKCLLCPQNMATNNTGSLVCVACAAGKTTDGRTGQVECVCDVGTEPGVDGECVTCRAGHFKATSTNKYANHACVNCSSCWAGQQVATECNSTIDVTCRACLANSW